MGWDQMLGPNGHAWGKEIYGISTDIAKETRQPWKKCRHASLEYALGGKTHLVTMARSLVNARFRSETMRDGARCACQLNRALCAIIVGKDQVCMSIFVCERKQGRQFDSRPS